MGLKSTFINILLNWSNLFFQTGIRNDSCSTPLPGNVSTIPQEARVNVSQPRPLPMPEYGGFFALLSEYLPESSQPISGFHRSVLELKALFSLCSIVSYVASGIL